MCTSNVYESLNHEDKSMVDELICIWEWDGGKMSEELIPSQMEIVRYHMIPLDGMECPLIDKTASGRKGFKFPSHCFKQFKGISVQESIKIKEYIWGKLNTSENIYINNWKDGQTVFMDQTITLHARPTNVRDGDTRTMARMVSYLDKLFPNQEIEEPIQWKGELYSPEEFANLINIQRKKEFFEETGILI
jgi:alpha-ketoglutarate-dependent taurine dioxygenase